MSNQTALLIVDMQVNMLDEETMPIYRGKETLATLADLATRARANDVPVIYVRHNGGPGEPDEPSAPELIAKLHRETSAQLFPADEITFS